MHEWICAIGRINNGLPDGQPKIYGTSSNWMGVPAARARRHRLVRQRLRLVLGSCVIKESESRSIGLKRRYLAALQKHMVSVPRASLRTARTLGQQAEAAGLATSDLARIHEQALMTLVSHSDSSRSNDGKITRAAGFFIEALAPMGNGHRPGAGKVRQLTRRKGTMQEGTAALAAAKLQLQSEMARRKTLEWSLKKSEQHYDTLLTRSRRIQEQLRRLSHEILSAQEQERKKISRELHDEIGQTLTAINVKLATLKKAATVTTKQLKTTISSTQRLVEKSMNKLHRFARELRPPMLDDLGLIPALHAHMKSFTRRTGIPVRCTAFAEVEKLDGDKRMVLYRVAQGVFANIAKQARASLVSVIIRRVNGFVSMEIHDNGRSFDARRLLVAKTSVGLRLLEMGERVKMVGGRLDVESEPGKGTTIRAQISLSRGE